jgi:hypothetical protein
MSSNPFECQVRIMPANKLLALFFATILLVILAGCGGGGQMAKPVAAGFSNASLNGTYAFAITGQNGNGFFSAAGSFTANGNGTIIAGTEDFTNPVAVFPNQAITGTYAVRSDGRTSATLTGANVTMNLDFVLLNTSTGLAIRFQNAATGSGSIDMQTSSAFNLASLAGTFAFNVAGVNTAHNSEATAGAATFDSSGNLTAGVLDDNNNGTVTANAVITPAALALSSPVSGTGRGTLTFNSPVNGATLHFAYYVVDANHIKLVEIDSAVNTPFLGGDAFRQSSTTVSGNFAFTVAGATASGNGVFAGGGILNTDGAGNVLNSSVTDFYNGGTLFSAQGTTGTYNVAGSGRGTMILNGGFGTLTFAIYPSSGGLQILELDSAVLSSGAALAQSGAPFSNSSINGGFGLNLSGADLIAGAEVDGIAQLNTAGTGTLSGAFDFNDGGGLFNSLALNGTYSANSNGRGTMTLKPSTLGTFNVIFYMTSGSRVLFLEPDTNQVSVGSFSFQ